MHGKSLFLATTALAALAVTACSRSEKPATEAAPATAAPAETAAAPAATSPAASEKIEMQITDLVPGTGAEIKTGQSALVHYTGWLYDANAPENKGNQFDSSVGREPYEFPVGAGSVIAGWDQGVVGMKVGGKRRLVIPPLMAYGEGGHPPVIPPNSTLVFDVELVEIR